MLKTSLNQIHKDQQAKIVEFAGYEMPIQYSEGMLKEHLWVRQNNVGIFDVSHMGQFIIEGENVAQFLCKITPSNFIITKPFQAKYSVLTNKNGGIIDDLIITRLEENKFFIVLNAACKQKDVNWIKSNLNDNISFNELSSNSLIAIQGEKSQEILSQLINEDNLADLAYMNLGIFTYNNQKIYISRTGYTGEDGFEVSIHNDHAAQFWLDLSKYPKVKPIGLGARDSLRLEMGYPLYGHDLNDNITPIEAGLSWVVSKTNNSFIGSDIIINQKNNGANKKRFGIKLTDRGVIREGFEVSKNDNIISTLTSGGYSPSLQASIGMGYFDSNNVAIGDKVEVIIRNKKVSAIITEPNFIKARTKTLKKL